MCLITNQPHGKNVRQCIYYQVSALAYKQLQPLIKILVFFHTIIVSLYLLPLYVKAEGLEAGFYVLVASINEVGVVYGGGAFRHRRGDDIGQPAAQVGALELFATQRGRAFD